MKKRIATENSGCASSLLVDDGTQEKKEYVKIARPEYKSGVYVGLLCRNGRATGIICLGRSSVHSAAGQEAAIERHLCLYLFVLSS